MKYFEVAENLSKEIMPIYIIFGQDEYLKQKNNHIFEYELNYFYNEENFIINLQGFLWGLKKLIVKSTQRKYVPMHKIHVLILSQEKIFFAK